MLNHQVNTDKDDSLDIASGASSIRGKKLSSADYSFLYVALVGSAAHLRGNSCPVAILPPYMRACTGVRMNTACDLPHDRPVGAGTGSAAVGARCSGEPGGGVKCFEQAGRMGSVRRIVEAISSRQGPRNISAAPYYLPGFPCPTTSRSQARARPTSLQRPGSSRAARPAFSASPIRKGVSPQARIGWSKP